MNPYVQLPDFDTLMALHQTDPEAFEQFRRKILREAVDEAPAAHRPALERLLSRIETAREHAATPMDAVIAASRMMHDSVGQLQQAWHDAEHAIAGLQATCLIERVRA